MSNIPFEFQRRADLVRAYLRSINRELFKRIEDLARYAIEVRIVEVITKIRLVIFEAIERQNEKIVQDVYGLPSEELFKPLKLDEQSKNFVQDILRVLPDLKKAVRVFNRELGIFDEDDVKEFEDIEKFLTKLREKGYI